MATYLVTGGAGFIGSNLCASLRADGHAVIALDNLSVSDHNVPFLKEHGVRFVKADIANYAAMEPAFAGVDVVFHLAAMNRAPRSIEDPVGAHHANITGTLHVLEAMRKHSVPVVVFASSSSVYAGRSGLLKEDDNLGPPHPYGVGKLAGEHYMRIYGELFGIKHVTLRFFSVYGPRQLGDIQHAAVIPKFIHAARHGKSLPVYGDGSALRNYTFVDDVVRCCRLAASTSEAHGQIINIANPEEASVETIGKFVLAITGSPSFIAYEAARPGDPLRNAPDVSKAQRILGFYPQISYEEGIRRTVAWFDEHIHKPVLASPSP